MKNYWLIGGAALLGLLLIASVVAAVLQKEADFAPGSPEAAVQAYLRALEEDDFQAAHHALSPELRERCSIEDMFGGRDPHVWRSSDRRITLEEVRTLGDTTFVEIRIAGFRNGGLFGPSEYDFDESFALRQFDGEWKLSHNPLPYFECARPIPEPTRTSAQ